MICKLAKCKNKVPHGRRAYCCPEHSKIGASNTQIIKYARGGRYFVCSAKGCSRLYVRSNEGKQCAKHRTGANGYCHKKGCGREIPISRTVRALFCCAAHGKEQRLADLMAARAKKVKAEFVCVAPGCNNKFTKNSNAQKYCAECQKLQKSNEFYYKYSPDKTLERVPNDGSIATGKSYHDFRTDICKSGANQCANFSACSDSVFEFPPHGRFKYQINGGVDCYEMNKDDVRRVNYGSSVGICSINK